MRIVSAKQAHYLICMLLVLFFFTSTSAQTNGLLNKRKKLNISDFKGMPDPNSDFLARTNPIITLEYFSPVACIDKNKLKLTVFTGVTVSAKSWIKLNKIKSKETLNELLSHEQGHYDIGEVFASDLQKTLSNTCLDKSSYKAQADSLFKAMNRHYDSIQVKYDIDTDHMRNREMQSKWKEKIAVMVEKMGSAPGTHAF